jgi:hypothetical protein
MEAGLSSRILGKQLIGDGLVSQEQLQQALATQAETGGQLDTTLLEMGIIDEHSLLAALGRAYRTRTANAADLAAARPELARLISPRVAKRYEVVPFHLEGKRLSIAMLNPGDLMIEDEISLLTGHMVASHIALEVRLYEALARLYKAQRSARLVSIAKRLSSGRLSRPRPTSPPNRLPEVSEPGPQPSSPAPTATEVAPEQEPAPVAADGSLFETRPELSPESPPAAPTLKSRERVTELEISEDDLSLFPSLKAEIMADEPPTEAAEEPAGRSDEAAEEPVTEVTEVGAEPLQELLQEDQTDPELRLAMAAVELLNAEMREDIADTLLAYCTPYLRRRALLFLRKDHVIGWRAEGQGVDQKALKEVEIPTSEPSVFGSLAQGAGFWRGPLPPLARNQDLIAGLGGDTLPECVVLPVVVRSKTVCFLYGDNMDGGLTDLPLAQLRRLVTKAGVAFQVYILKSKIRTL